ncbi:MAG: histidine phosphatase family protein [Pseudomonadota bacterium]|nr:histidine phosphatase family protein [Pseudomonadota bacterium]
MLYFIRHGQTDWNVQQRIQGMTDIPLNETGILQAYQASDQVRPKKWQAVISSPLSRARQTAEILGKAVGLTVQTDDRLCEFDLGELEGTSLTKLTPDMWQLLAEKPKRLKAEGLSEAYDRISSFMREMNPDADKLIVMHSGIYKMISYYTRYQNGFDYNLFSPNYRDLWIPNTTLIPMEKSVEIPHKIKRHSLNEGVMMNTPYTR